LRTCSPDAIAFYERCRLRLAAVHPGAVDAARAIKPEIPEFAGDSTPISDELEFELGLDGYLPSAPSGRDSG
jgi:hypothetical protein